MKFKLGMTSLLAGAVLVGPVLAGNDREEAAVALYAISQSGVTATRALELAKQAVTGVVYEYELEDDDGELFHEIELINLETETKYKVKVAVRDGGLTQKSEQYSCSLVCRDDDVKAVRALTEAGFTLEAALAKAALGPEQLLEEAELEVERGVRYFKLETVGPDGERDLLIDIDKGQAIPSLTRAD